MHWAPRGVILDMDGLLLDTERLSFVAFCAAATTVDLPVPDGLWRSLVGWSDEYVDDVVRRVCGGSAKVTSFLAEWDRLYAAAVSESAALKPGVDALLEWLDKAEMPTAVATSASSVQATRCLTAVGIAGRFEVIVTADDVPAPKPAPSLFLAAAEQLCIRPTLCIAFEDSACGVDAAVDAAIPVVFVEDLQPPSLRVHERAYAVVGSLTAATRLLATICGGSPCGSKRRG